MKTRLWFVVLALLSANSSYAFEDMGLRPRWDDPARRQQALEMGPRLDRIDEIEDSMLSTPQAAGDSLLIELVRLYRSSPLMKHRVRALEWSDSLSDTQRSQERALTFQRTFNPWDAREAILELRKAEPGNAEPLRWLGMLRLEEGLTNPKWLNESLEWFLAATECGNSKIDDWLGVAAVHLIREDYEALAKIVDELLSRAADKPGPYLLAAIAHEATGLPSRAAQEFQAAFDLMSPQMRRRFEYPNPIILRSDNALSGSTLVEAPQPPPIRGWWIRMTEAEALFSDPDAGQHTWDTAPGQVYLLFGRPLHMRRFWYASLDEITMGGPWARHADQIRRQANAARLISGAEKWIWIVRTRSGLEHPIVFEAWSRFARWHASPVAEIEVIDPQKKVGPIRLAESVPDAPPPPGLELEVLSTGFRTGRQEMRIESWVAVEADPVPEHSRVRLRLFDGTGKEIDRVVRPLGDGRSREDIRRHVRGYPRGARGWLHGFGALVPPGRYATLIELLGPEDVVLASRDQALHFRDDEDDRTSFSLSDLILCDAYLENAPLDGVPPEAVRFARVVVPHPEPALHPDQHEVSVYYEIYGAQTDATGQTQIEVEYEVYPRAGYDPYVGGGAYVDGELVRPAIRAHFPDERTGRTGGGVVVKGTSFNLSEFEAGDYVLMVRVGDRIAQREASRVVFFTIPADESEDVSGR